MNGGRCVKRLLVHGLICLTIAFAFSQQGSAWQTTYDSNLSKLSTIQSRKEVLAKLIAERDHFVEANDTTQLVNTLNRIVEVNLKLRDFPAALSSATESVASARRIENNDLLIESLCALAEVEVHRHQNRVALATFEEALTLSRANRNRRGEAKSLTGLGLASYQLSDLANAERYNDLALTVWRELSDQPGLARTLKHQGETYMLQDRYDESAAVLTEANNILRTLQDALELASTLVDQSFLAMRRGEWQEALSRLNEAERLIIDKDAEPFLAGQIAMSFGEAYEAHGQLDMALVSFKQSLVNYRDRAHDDRGTIDAGNKTARVQALLGQYDEAASLILEGLRIARGLDDEFAMGLCHEDLGRVWLAASRYEDARQQFLQAIRLYDKTGNRRPGARAHAALGQAAYFKKDFSTARMAYRKALHVFEAIQDSTNEAALNFAVGRLELRMGNVEAAGRHLQKSIAVTETLRGNVSTKDLRTSYLASVHDRYDAYVDYLMRVRTAETAANLEREALEACEQGRARVLSQHLREARVDIYQGIDPLLVQRHKSVGSLLNAKAERRARLLAANQDASAISSEIDSLTSEHEQIETQIKSSNPHFATLTQPQPLTVDQIQQQVLDKDSVLVEYLLGEERSYMWLVTTTTVSSFQLPSRARIESDARRFLELLTAHHPLDGETTQQHQARIRQADAQFPEAAASLSDLLIGPIQTKLGTKRLLIVPDGALHHIPFHALTVALGPGSTPNERVPLQVNHEVVYEPSASALALLLDDSPRREPDDSVAVFADPVFEADDRRVKLRAQASDTLAQQTVVRGVFRDLGVSDNRIPALPASREEAEAILSVAPWGTGYVAMGFKANRAAVTAPELARYRIVHFATHGVVDYKHPELSGLVLSLVDENGQAQEGHLRLRAIYNLKLSANLVVLSACNTGVGKEIRGEGLIGLTRGFMYAGADSVVASLWKVDDEATAALMARFYEGMFVKGLRPAAALREAQLWMRSNERWRAPYFWAGFIMQGRYDQVQNARFSSSRAQTVVVSAGVISILLLMACLFAGRRRSRAV